MPHGGRAIAFVDAGRVLLVGRAGQLARYVYHGKKFIKSHDVAAAVRGFTWLEDQGTLLVNQGLHGVTLYRVDDTGFSESGTVKHEGVVQHVAASRDLHYLATTDQHSAEVRMYEISQL